MRLPVGWVAPILVGTPLPGRVGAALRRGEKGSSGLHPVGEEVPPSQMNPSLEGVVHRRGRSSPGAALRGTASAEPLQFLGIVPIPVVATSWSVPLPAGATPGKCSTSLRGSLQDPRRVLPAQGWSLRPPFRIPPRPPGWHPSWTRPSQVWVHARGWCSAQEFHPRRHPGWVTSQRGCLQWLRAVSISPSSVGASHPSVAFQRQLLPVEWDSALRGAPQGGSSSKGILELVHPRTGGVAPSWYRVAIEVVQGRRRVIDQRGQAYYIERGWDDAWVGTFALGPQGWWTAPRAGLPPRTPLVGVDAAARWWAAAAGEEGVRRDMEKGGGSRVWDASALVGGGYAATPDPPNPEGQGDCHLRRPDQPPARGPRRWTRSSASR